MYALDVDRLQHVVEQLHTGISSQILMYLESNTKCLQELV